MKFERIDMNQWDRADLFRHFIENMRCVMSLTVDVDVTPFLDYVKANGLKFYPSMLWVVSRAINGRPEFRMGYGPEGDVVRWDFVSPYYAHFYPEEEAFAKLVTEYNPDFAAFHSRFLADRARFQNERGFSLKNIPPNVFDVSCLPWVSYKSVDMHIFDSGTYLAPVVTWGRFTRHGSRATMPLSMNIHHAVADGFHLCRFFADVQQLFNRMGG